ncbi:hypothetical protein GWK47_020252 [Chionoecetes opilio]|uniref:Uncharacterized protein n=1 Tax=Chionoecetes opilio TaxID=41210 RepID=A0A8J4XPT8_CHIOP|nr:hypothetical protein GWK47_020252 [Chionoecetes opilio]
MDACRLHSSVQYRPLDPPANRNDEWDGASLDVFSRPSVHPDLVRTGLNQGEVQRALKGQKEDEEEADAAPRKRARRSEQLKFNFFEHCIFCGEDCQVKKNPKHPSRWKPAYLCRQVNRPEQKMSLKTEILAKCDERNDDWAAQVRIRVSQ